MSACVVEPYEDSPQIRTDLARFLERTFAGAATADAWMARFSHWWDTNPCAHLVRERGWVLRESASGALAGFLGLIPACYAVKGEPTPAVAPTTWVVDPRHRQSALMLARRLGKLEGQVLIVSTTSRRDFQARLARRGWVLNDKAVRRFIPCGLLARFLLGSPPPLHPGKRVITDIAEARSLTRPFQKQGSIEKWITLDYLRWYLHSPAREHHFAGVVDESGQLTSFLILAPAPLYRLSGVWSVVDWFTTENDHNELRALLAAVTQSTIWRRTGATATPRPPWLIRLVSLQADPAWSQLRSLTRARVTLNHLHAAPSSCTTLPKHCVPAEGDLGL